MLDYSAIAALAAIVETQSFQAAAQKLFITQSAVSQRIKALENYYGEPVLIRTLPLRPTKLGLILLGTYKKIALLEEGVHEVLRSQTYSPTISIAISRDSLETWFVTIMDQLKQIQPIQLEIIADDQDFTLNYLQNGLVSACASTIAKNLSGCKSEFMGYFDYVLVASPQFKKKYFNNNQNAHTNLLNAPAVIFDQKDKLHANYLNHFFNLSDATIRYHVIPSVAGFRHFALNGYAYALIPKIDITQELKQQKLINLFPDKIWQMPLYWHSWSVETKGYKSFNELVLKLGREILRQQ